MTRRDLLKRGAVLGAATMLNSLVIIEKAPAAPTFVEGSDAPGAAEALAKMFGGPESGSWLTTKLPDNTAVAPGSADAVATIVHYEQALGGWLNGIVDSKFTSTINVVPADYPLQPAVATDPTRNANSPGFSQVLSHGIPYPPELTPPAAGDTDASMTVIQPDYETTVNGVTYKGRLYETWVTTPPQSSASGKWEAVWGGRAVDVANTGGFWLAGHWGDWWWGDADTPHQWEADGIAMSHDMGAMATSLPMYVTLVSRLDVMRGRINHPIGLEMPITGSPSEQAGPVWPAQRYDGSSRIAMQQGSRFRLPASYQIDAGWPWFTQLLATCAKEYGIVFCDTTGPNTGPTFRCEPGVAALTPSGSVDIGSVMSAFPWADLEQIAVGNDSVYNPLS